MSRDPDEDFDDFDDRPSKSERKRNAHEAQELGVELVKLKDLDLKAFELPESLYDAIVEARRLTSRAGAGTAAPAHRQADARGRPRAHPRARSPRGGAEAARKHSVSSGSSTGRTALIAEGAPGPR